MTKERLKKEWCGQCIAHARIGPEIQQEFPQDVSAAQNLPEWPQVDVQNVLRLFLTLNYYDISFTHRSDSIALDSFHMTYLRRSQSASLRTFPL